MKKIITVVTLSFSLMLVLAFNFKALDIPTAEITNIHADTDSIAVTYDLVDTAENVIMNTEDYYSTIALSSDGQVVQEIKIEEGTNHVVEFDTLDSNTEYTIDINVPYDLLASNSPFNEAPYTILSQNAFTHKATPTGEILATSKSTFNSIFVDTQITDVDNAIIDTARLELVLNEQIVDTYYLEESSYTFEELEFNTDYTVNLIASYDLDNDGVSEGEDTLSTKDFTTGDFYAVPTANFNEPTITADSLLINYDLIDEDNTLLPDKARLLLKDDTGQLTHIEIPTVGVNQTHLFSDLEKGNYTVEITGQYDIDGDGIAENESPYLLGSKDYEIGAVTPPTGTLTLTPSVNSISASYVVNDLVDQVTLKLYKGTQLVKEVTDPTSPYIFDSLDPATSYKVELTSGGVVLDTKSVSTLTEGVHTILECKDLESIGRGPDYEGATHDDAWEFDDDYVLGNDIDCSETRDVALYGEDGFDPIGKWTDINGNGNEDSREIEGFSGNLEGENHLISNLYINRSTSASLFKSLELNSYVSNITFQNVDVKSTGDGSAAVLAIYGKDTIKGINANGSISSKNADAGGIVTYLSGREEENTNSAGIHESVKMNGNISDSKFTGKVTSAATSGGISALSTGKISNVEVEANIEGVDDVGGLVGHLYGGIQYGSDYSSSYNTKYNGHIDGAIFSGTVTSKKNAGGIAGTSNGKIINVEVISEIYGVEYSGGIVGMNLGGSDDYSDVHGNMNNGQIQTGHISNFVCNSIVMSDSIAGGVSGYSDGTITDGVSNGEVKSPFYSGGIVGNSKNYEESIYVENIPEAVNTTRYNSIIQNVVNNSEVYGANYSAGIYAHGSAELRNSVSYGDVEGNHAAGIAALVETGQIGTGCDYYQYCDEKMYKTSLENVSSYGNITGKQISSGIIGEIVLVKDLEYAPIEIGSVISASDIRGSEGAKIAGVLASGAQENIFSGTQLFTGSLSGKGVSTAYIISEINSANSYYYDNLVCNLHDTTMCEYNNSIPVTSKDLKTSSWFSKAFINNPSYNYSKADSGIYPTLNNSDNGLELANQVEIYLP